MTVMLNPNLPYFGCRQPHGEDEYEADECHVAFNRG